VKLESTTEEALQMFELQVISIDDNNVALSGSASQSSTFKDSEVKFGASKAIDNNNSTFSHTNLGVGAWWEVELLEVVDVESVVILNRYCNGQQDPTGCLCRMSGAELKLYDDSGTVIASRIFPDTCNKKLLVESFASCQAEQQSESPASCRASLVKLESTTEYPLQMFEVQVISGGPNIALSGTASQSSTFKDNEVKFGASKAIDNDNSTFSHTYLGVGAWWQVDLQGLFDIESVVILNRYCGQQDPTGCLCRMSGAELKLYDDSGGLLEARRLGNTCGELLLVESFASCAGRTPINRKLRGTYL
jgi:hypothetical protein